MQQSKSTRYSKDIWLRKVAKAVWNYSKKVINLDWAGVS